MAEDTEIAWCDSTFNPWIGCTKVGPGCDNCYAEADFDLRKHRAKWGPGNPRSRTSAANWKKPLQWNKKQFFSCRKCGWRGELEDALGYQPKGALTLFATSCRNCGGSGTVSPSRRRVFCASLSDVFDNEVPADWRRDLFDLIRATPNLDWLLLTKRIGNAQRLFDDAHMDPPDGGSGYDWPTNVWLGATICNQEEADRDIPKLLATPAHVRFLSMEPLLGPVDLLRWISPVSHVLGTLYQKPFALSWVIVGGESGPNARPMHGSWAYDLHDQCESAGVPFLFKQWGEWVNAGARAFGTAAGEVRHIRSDGTFWNEGDGALQDECADVLTVVRVGKKAAGRDLGGVQHDGYPEAKP